MTGPPRIIDLFPLSLASFRRTENGFAALYRTSPEGAWTVLTDATGEALAFDTPAEAIWAGKLMSRIPEGAVFKTPDGLSFGDQLSMF